MSKVTVAIAGLGGRGRHAYARCAQLFPDKMEIVAVADLLPERVAEAAETFGVPAAGCFSSAEEMLEAGKLADVMFICTPDRCHASQALAALEQGYHLLLEKPISPELEECNQILESALRNQRHVVVCHVLRYTPFFQQIKKAVESGAIGEVVSIQAIENVGYWHQAHSFVRGNWRNSRETCCMILAKSCHDMDILLWLAGKKLQAVSSFGGLHLFREDKAPEGSAKRCLDGCKVKDSCPYDAEKIYLTDPETGFLPGKNAWPSNVLVDVNPTEERIREAIRTGPYGRCVYHCDNDVVDHQVVNLLLEDGVTVNFTMCAFTNRNTRSLKIMGTMGDIEAAMDTNLIRIKPFLGKETVVDVAALADDLEGHAGGDHRMVEELLDLVGGTGDGKAALTSITDSMDSHYASLAAEYSRLHGGAGVNIAEFTK